MTANLSSFHQNYMTDKKSNDVVQKDIKKWVDSVVEFKANVEKQRSEIPLERHLKRIKKLKMKKKASLVTVPMGSNKNTGSGPRKNLKAKKPVKNPEKGQQPRKKPSPPPADAFDLIKESYRNLKLPQNWTSGLSNGRVVFNRIKVTTHNSQQKMAVERSLVITKDRNVHVLINGSEVALNNWELQKIDTVDDVKKAIRDIDLLKICSGPGNGPKNPQTENKLKPCPGVQSETTNPKKSSGKKHRSVKKSSPGKGIPKQKSFQK